MPVLSQAEIQKRLMDLPGWFEINGEIVKTYQLNSFPFAIEFVHQIADYAEAAGHHPDIDIRYNKVKLALSTHDEKGITEKDFALAQQIEDLYQAHS